MPRLRTVSPSDPGWSRRRCGKGFSRAKRDAEKFDRVIELGRKLPRVRKQLLASVDRAPSATKRKRQVKQVYDEVADLLGNTTAVARASYVDPRVVDLFEDGEAISVPRRTSSPRSR